MFELQLDYQRAQRRSRPVRWLNGPPVPADKTHARGILGSRDRLRGDKKIKILAFLANGWRNSVIASFIQVQLCAQKEVNGLEM